MDERAYRIFWLAILTVCAAMFAAYLGLTPLGHWQVDEYQTIRAVGDGGAGFLFQRVMGWSPRPMSEAFVYGYALLVEARHQPMVATVLVSCWSLLAIGVLVLPLRRGGVRSWLPVSAALLVLFFLGHPVSEMFYWPMATLAYVPTLAAIALLLGITQCLETSTVATWVLTSVALTVAAASTEVGAMFVVGFVVLLGMGWLPGATSYRRARIIALLPPTLMAAWVLRQLVVVRAGQDAEVFGNAAIAHHAFVAFKAMVPQAGREWLTLDPSRATDKQLTLGLIVKALFALGVYGLATHRHDAVAQRMRLSLALSALALVPATIFTAYYQFGSLCCERHATFRQCMVYVGIAAAASWLANWKHRQKGVAENDQRISMPAGKQAWFALASLLVAVLVAASSSVPRIRHDYLAYDRIAAARQATWDSGVANGRSGVFTRVVSGRIVGNDPKLPQGAVRVGDDKNADAILAYFGKDSLVVADEQIPAGGESPR
ncbi:hypothetical protein [Pinirhizobacter sp.]|jgi:hypothetical protein|uniref:hypothetical protein n=1 Tax=Pinirhizobacter sp. TaxID=2950432 RepID=UPI002F42958F